MSIQEAGYCNMAPSAGVVELEAGRVSAESEHHVIGRRVLGFQETKPALTDRHAQHTISDYSFVLSHLSASTTWLNSDSPRIKIGTTRSGRWDYHWIDHPSSHSSLILRTIHPPDIAFIPDFCFLLYSRLQQLSKFGSRSTSKIATTLFLENSLQLSNFLHARIITR
ncbi:hypothetical protein SISNIDRAFT_491524 [Sistotremastrum niveocremeum HHB9708]|uniref:Uncharacterized protein n=1 Tax=Sistotremastrum niveocremeum HHB9708 TaxID=1314777 RepID=A0A164MPE7_9AGAM|nr:hypothetical protein SISNIDRAFT_491524 [Sistotremastrum niveocremeum HHB9708]